MPTRKLKYLVVIGCFWTLVSAYPAFAGPGVKTPGGEVVSASHSTVLGHTTNLKIELLEGLPRHDAPSSTCTVLSLFNRRKEKIWTEKLNADWHCIGYSQARKAYVLQLHGEDVSVPADTSISYIPERSPHVEDSAFNKSNYTSRTLIADPTLKYIAFIGHRGSSQRFELVVLDTTKDVIHALGAPPAPPPITVISPLTADCDAWQWCLEGTLQLEPGIWSIRGNTLKVSYGRDTCKRRAKQRTVRQWDLSLLSK